MKYVSTRGGAPDLDFEEVLLGGLARDGGLYLPVRWPQLAPDEIARRAEQSYAAAAFAVMRPFVGGVIDDDDLERMITTAYAGFDDPAVAPLRRLGDGLFLLEMFHGPTLAFKDMAMQVLAPMMDHVLKRRGQRLTIVGATSGDTGGAAISAFRGRDAIDIFILHPHDRVSDFQRRQMTTATEANVFNIAVQGTFDDCQGLVKALFGDLAFRDRHALGAVNSINWARVMAQIVYYFTSAAASGAGTPVSFTVPTGNFGDIFAGYAAARMGLPVDRLVIATNINDILVRTLETGRYQPGIVSATSSPSMDIQVSSNFERLLFEAYDRDGAAVVRLMDDLARSGAFAIAPGPLEAIRARFDAGRASEAETMTIIGEVYEREGLLIDPHTAVGLAVARAGRTRGDAGPMIVLATADPAKFPDAIRTATGTVPEAPPGVLDALSGPERFTVMENDLDALRGFIEKNATTE